MKVRGIRAIGGSALGWAVALAAAGALAQSAVGPVPSGGKPAPQETAVDLIVGTGPIAAAELSPDETLVATAGESVARVFETATGKPVAAFAGHKQYIACLRFAPDGNSVVSAGWDGVAVQWNPRSGQEIRRFNAGEPIESLDIASDGSQLLTGGKTARLWDLRSGAMLKTFEVGDPTSPVGGADGIAFMPDGKSFAVGSSNYRGAVQIWSLDGKLLRSAADGGYILRAICVSADGKLILAGGSGFASDGKDAFDFQSAPTAILIDAQTGALLGKLAGYKGEVNAVALSPDGKLALTGSGNLETGVPGVAVDNTARLWDVATGKEIRVFSGHQHPVKSVAFSGDGKTILTGSTDGSARLWDAATGKAIRTFGDGYGMILDCALSPDGKRFVFATDGADAVVRDAATGAIVRVLECRDSPVTAVAIAPDSLQYATASDKGSIRLWDAATGEPSATLDAGDRISHLAYSPDGKRIAAGAGRSELIVWSLPGGKIEKKIALKTNLSGLAFAPDGGELWAGLFQIPLSYNVNGRPEPVEGASASNPFGAAPLAVFDAGEDWKMQELGFGDAMQIGPIVCSPDGAIAAAGMMRIGSKMPSYATILINMKTGKELRRVDSGEVGFEAIAFSSDSRRLLTSSLGPDPETKLWDIRSRALLASIPTKTGVIVALGFLPGDKKVWLASRDASVRVFAIPE